MTTIKELKKDAKVRLTGSYLKLTFMYLLCEVIISTFAALGSYISIGTVKFIFALLILAFSIPLSFGFISCFMDQIRGKKVPMTEFINVGLKSMSKTWKIYLRTLLKLIIPIILLLASMYFLFLTLASTVFGGPLTNYFILSTVLFMASALLLFIMKCYYGFTFYLLKDKPEKSAKEIVNMSHDLMKGNILRYIGLTLSFIGWYLLIYAILFISSYFIPRPFLVIILELSFVVLLPYITTAMIGFYEDVLYDKTNANEKE